MDETEISGADVIIVLGYPANSDGSPSDVMIARVNKGVALLKAGKAPYILFTGGGETNEALVMALFAKELGVPEDKIFTESESKDTVQNAKYCVDIMTSKNWTKAIVVTSPYHMKRSNIIFSKYKNFNFNIIKAESPENLSVITRINDILHEIFSFLIGAY